MLETREKVLSYIRNNEEELINLALDLGNIYAPSGRERFVGEYAQKVSEVLEVAGLDAKLVPNRDSLMILPPNVDKGTGVAATLQHFGETSEVFLTCFGDGENDLALFSPADLGVAVANAVDALKQIADVVTEKPGGLGVAEYLLETFLIEKTAKE